MKFSDLAFIVRLSISCWGAQKTDKTTSDEVLKAKGAKNNKVGRFVKNVLGGKCETLENINKFCASVRVQLDQYTLPCDNGSRLVAVTGAKNVYRMLKGAEIRFYELRDAFLDVYENIVKEAEQNSGDLYVEGQCPTKEEVSEKFSFNFSIEPVPSSNRFDETVDLEGLEATLKQEYDKKLERTFKEGEQHIKNKLKSRLEKVHAALVNFEGDGKTLSQRLLNGTVEVAQDVKELNIQQNLNIQNWCDRAAQVVSERPAKVYCLDVLSRNDAIQKLGGILREMEELG